MADPTPHRVHFLHISKCAGTQVAAVTAAVAPVILCHPHNVALRDLPAEQPWFFSIRNPVTRFVSGFYSRKRKGQPRYLVEWRLAEAQAFAAFEHANDLAEALFAPGPRGRAAFGAVHAIGHTARRQCDAFIGCGDFLTTRPPAWIIRQEQFGADMRRLLERIGLPQGNGPLPLAQDARGAHRNDYADVPALSDLAVENLSRWYASDQHLYALCDEWIGAQG